MTARPPTDAPPHLPIALMRALLPHAERDELVAELTSEFAEGAVANGRANATRWLVVAGGAHSSIPTLLRWTWWARLTRLRAAVERLPTPEVTQPGNPDDRRRAYAARRLRARPAYTLLAVLTLAVGIGGTAAVFGVARPLVFDPLPYANANEVGAFWMPGWWTEEELLFFFAESFPDLERRRVPAPGSGR